MILSGFCPGFGPQTGLLCANLTQFALVKLASKLGENLKVFRELECGSLGRTRTYDPVINSHPRTHKNSHRCVNCPDFVRGFSSKVVATEGVKDGQRRMAYGKGNL